MKYFKSVILSGLLLGFGACSDFLEEEPRDALAVEQYFVEPGQAESAVNYLYQNGVPSLYTDAGVFRGSRIMFAQYQSGYFSNEFSGQERQVDLAQQLALTPTNVDGDVNNLWANLYRGIAGANIAIANISETPGLSDQERLNLVAQASFFRGFAYFYLVRLFGDVPLLTEPIQSLDEILVPRSPEADVYAQILADLTVATAPGSLASGNMVDNGYRITTETAQMVLADVHLTMSGFPLQADNYANAATAARAVINSGAFSLVPHDLNDSGEVDFENSAYNKMRNSKTLPEDYIYQIEFEAGIRNFNYVEWSFPAAAAGSLKSAYANVQSAFGPRPAIYNQYDQEVDLRVQEKQYFHSSYTLPDGEVIDYPVTPYIWFDEDVFFTTAQSSKNVRVYSYPEALLVGAEAIARSEGVTAEAVDYLTQVRARAYWTTDAETIRTELAALSVDDFVEQVWLERNRELIFDVKIWFDMIRTRQYSEGADGGATFVDFIGASSSFGPTFEEKHLLLPIADSEIQRNSELVQNPGY